MTIAPGRIKERGNATIMVLVTMTVIMMLVTALVEHLAAAEASAIASHLARIRIHWAMRGHLDWILSRARGNVITAAGAGARQNGTIGFPALNGAGSIDDSMSVVDLDKLARMTDPVSSFFRESQTVGSTLGAIVQPSGNNARWAYPEYGSNYTFEITVTAADNGFPPLGSSLTPGDGRLLLQFGVANPGPLPILGEAADQMGSLRIDLCIGSIATPATPPRYGRTIGQSCASNNDKNDNTGPPVVTVNSYSSIERMTVVH